MPFTEITLPSSDTTQVAFDQTTEQVRVTINLEGDHDVVALKQFKEKAKQHPLPGYQFQEIDPVNDRSWCFIPEANVHTLPLAFLPQNSAAQCLLVALLPDLLTSDVLRKVRAFPIEPKYCFVQFTAARQQIVLWDVEIPGAPPTPGIAAPRIAAPRLRLPGIVPKERPDVQARHRERMSNQAGWPLSALFCLPESMRAAMSMDLGGAKAEKSPVELFQKSLYELGMSILLNYVESETIAEFFTGQRDSHTIQVLDGIMKKNQAEKEVFLAKKGLDPQLQAFISAAWDSDPEQREKRVFAWVKAVQSAPLIDAALEKKKMTHTVQFEKTRLPESTLRKASTQSKARQADPDVLPGRHRRTYSI